MSTFHKDLSTCLESALDYHRFRIFSCELGIYGVESFPRGAHSIKDKKPCVFTTYSKTPLYTFFWGYKVKKYTYIFDDKNTMTICICT